MSGVMQQAVMAKATLACDRCDAWWASKTYTPQKWGDDVRAAEPAFRAGWRVYASGKGQRTYCPSCAPSVPMRLVHGRQGS